MADQPVIELPPLVGGQADSWAALIELAPVLGDNWLLVGGQMVFLHELERQSTDVRPTDDIDVVVDLRAEPAGLARIHSVLRDGGRGSEVSGENQSRVADACGSCNDRKPGPYVGLSRKRRGSR